MKFDVLALYKKDSIFYTINPVWKIGLPFFNEDEWFLKNEETKSTVFIGTKKEIFDKIGELGIKKVF
ncbi:hypothetical protein [Clostridium perfringens]|uniref:hypothetical protein n=1 Tax=Clostridium perfringens TaxID=1502 RepID=UPI002341D16F|nr:hypothetical protein [Clostridium perfringens]MDC4245591.1 hypothetical protein [Clostridium perfringens]